MATSSPGTTDTGVSYNSFDVVGVALMKQKNERFKKTFPSPSLPLSHSLEMDGRGTSSTFGRGGGLGISFVESSSATLLSPSPSSGSSSRRRGGMRRVVAVFFRLLEPRSSATGGEGVRRRFERDLLDPSSTGSGCKTRKKVT